MYQKYDMVVILSIVVALLVSFSTAQGVQPNNSCQNVTCAANQECQLVQVQCIRAPCDPVPQCVPACSPLTGCNVSCSNGLVKDDNGCDTCTCRVCAADPCPGMFCPYGKATDGDGCVLCPCYQPCVVMDCPSGTLCQVAKNATTNAFYGQCVGIVTNPPCPQIQCTNICRLGYKSSSNGCRTCDCYDPCQSYSCPDGQRCVLSPDDCPPGAECRDAPMPYCIDTTTVSLSTSSKVPDQINNMNVTAMPATNVSSPANFCLMTRDIGPCNGSFDRWYYSAASRACAVFNYGGCGGNGNNFPTKDVCLGRCNAAGSNCPEVMCESNCQIVRDQFGCQTCSCVTDCFAQGCPEYQQCMMMPGNCANSTNCPPTPRCISKPDFVCEERNCTLSCPTGWMTDSRGCAICQCNQCGDVMCTADSVCPYGRAKGGDGCDTCECYQPCQNLSCPGNTSCVVSEECRPDEDCTPEVRYKGECPSASTSTTTFPSTLKTTAIIQCAMPMCFVPPCTYGLSSDENGCLTCNCAPNPCQDHTCSDSNEICRAILYCPSSGCHPPFQTVCVDRTRPCEALQMEYGRIFSNSVGKMPQLNCDSSGRFKPTQCYGQECWCVDDSGTETTNKSDQSINCYNGSQILLETVRIDADFGIIKPEDGWKFKQELSQQIADLLSVVESLVTITKLEKGSIIAGVAVATDVISPDLKAQTFEFRYDNATYPSRFESGNPSPTLFSLGFPSSVPPTSILTESNASSSGQSGQENTNHVLMIILICIFVPIAFVAVAATIWLACKTCRNQRMIPSKPLKSELSVDVTSLESGSEKSYPEDYKSDQKEVRPISTTEA